MSLKRFLMPTAFILIMLLLISVAGPSARAAKADEKNKRMIILGFDGVEPTIAEKLMDEGRLPNLAKLRDSGTYTPLGTSIPSQSPVSWSCFATGMNPGKTGIFDFVIRDPDTYLPKLGFSEKKSKQLLSNRSKITYIFLTFIVFGGIVWLFSRFMLRQSKLSSILAAIILAALVTTAVGVFLRYVPYKIPSAKLLRDGTTFWKYLDDTGKRCKILQAPLNFPPNEELKHSQMLCGLGVPDIRETNGFWFIYKGEPVASDELTREMQKAKEQENKKEDTVTGGELIRLDTSRNPIITYIHGPRNFLENSPDYKVGELVEVEMELRFSQKLKNLQINIQGREIMLQEGEWSDFVDIVFTLNPIISITGTTRFHLVGTNPEYQLYVEPLNFNPVKMPGNLTISTPKKYSKQLVEQYGMFETLGWCVATNPLKDEAINDDEFLEDMHFAMENRRKIFMGELAKDDWDMYFGVFMAPDRVQHMFFRAIDERHPLYTPELNAKYGQEIYKVYEWMDDIVGETMAKHVDDNTTLMVISDHGFHEWHKEVNLNRWLAENGFLKLKDNPIASMKVSDLFSNKNIFANVDWRYTKAYSMGIGKIYINEAGRESKGIVYKGAQKDKVIQDIIKGLKELKDEDGTNVVNNVYITDEVYSGPHKGKTADLEVGFNDGYRVSWQSTLGGIGGPVLEPNMNKWSGDHCSLDPAITKGIFFSNKKINAEDPEIIDLAPTALSYFGVKIPKDMDGKPLL